jgi:hypothetical protein
MPASIGTECQRLLLAISCGLSAMPVLVWREEIANQCDFPTPINSRFEQLFSEPNMVTQVSI